MSIKQKLIISFLTIALIPILLIAILSYFNAKEALMSARFEGLESITHLKVNQIEELFSNIKEEINIAQDYFNIKTNLPIVTKLASGRTNPEYMAAKEMLDGQFKTWLKVKSEVIDFMLVSPEGKIVYVTNEEHEAIDLGNPLPDPDGKAFEMGKSGFYVSDVFRNGVEANRLGMLITAPVDDFNGKFIGVIVLEIDMRPIYELIQDTTGLGETGETLIGKRVGNEVVFLNPLRHDSDAALNRKVTLRRSGAIPIQKAAFGDHGHSISVDYRGEEIIAYWEYIPSLDWGLVAKIDTKEAFASIVSLRNWIIRIGIIFLSLVVIAALSTAKSIAKPIQLLKKGTEIIGGGDLSYKVGTAAKDEVGQLSRAFDRMTQNLGKSVFNLHKEIREHERTEAKLTEKVRLLDLIFKHTLDSIVLMDRDFNFICVSDSYARFCQMTPSEFLGRNHFEVFPSPFEQEVRPYVKKKMIYKKENRPFVFPDHPEWGITYWDLGLVPILGKDDEVEFLLFTLKDTTGRVQAEEELERSRGYLEKLHNSIGDPIFSVKLPERVVDHMNSSVETVFGYKPEECMGKSTEMFYPERKDFLDFGKKLKRALEQNESVLHTEQVMKRKNGEAFPTDIMTTFLREDGKATQVISIVRDITERKQHEKAMLDKTEKLNSMNEELHKLAMEMTRVEEKEKKRLAEILHEGIGQNLVAIKIAFESGENLSEIVPLINETIKVARTVTTNLYPPIFDRMGFVKGLEWYTNSISTAKKIKVSLDIDEIEEYMTEELKGDFFRIIRECFQNTIKYASASRIDVKLKKNKGSLQLNVKDNGIGFNSKEKDITMKSGSGIGFMLIREWVKSLGGNLKIESQPGKGTEIIVKLPKTMHSVKKKKKK